MNKTIHIKTEDSALWDAAQSVASLRQTSVSRVIMDHLRWYVEQNKPFMAKVAEAMNEYSVSAAQKAQGEDE